MNRGSRWTAAILLPALAAAAGVIWLLGNSEPDPVIAEVNGIAIHQSDADTRVEGLASVHGTIEEMLGEDWRPTVLKTLVDDVIVKIEAERSGVAVSDADLEAAVANVVRMSGGEDGWDDWLAQNSLTETDVEERLYLQLLSARVYEAVTADIAPTDEELRDYYDENIDQYAVDGEPRPFLEVRTGIEETLTKQMKDAAYGDWLLAQREQVTVEVIDDAWR